MAFSTYVGDFPAFLTQIAPAPSLGLRPPTYTILSLRHGMKEISPTMMLNNAGVNNLRYSSQKS
jgi:hypothetical protein